MTSGDAGDTPGQRLERRMDELGVSKTQLHQASGKSRTTINRALDDHPKARPTTYADLMRVLDDIEADREPGPERYYAGGEPELVTIEMTGVFGIETVTFSGPPEDVDAVRKAAVDFVRQVREGIVNNNGGS